MVLYISCRTTSQYNFCNSRLWSKSVFLSKPLNKRLCLASLLAPPPVSRFGRSPPAGRPAFFPFFARQKVSRMFSPKPAGRLAGRGPSTASTGTFRSLHRSFPRDLPEPPPGPLERHPKPPRDPPDVQRWPTSRFHKNFEDAFWILGSGLKTDDRPGPDECLGSSMARLKIVLSI